MMGGLHNWQVLVNRCTFNPSLYAYNLLAVCLSFHCDTMRTHLVFVASAYALSTLHLSRHILQAILDLGTMLQVLILGIPSLIRFSVL